MPADITLIIDERERTEFLPYLPCLDDGPEAANSVAYTQMPRFERCGKPCFNGGAGWSCSNVYGRGSRHKASAFALFASTTVPMRSISGSPP